MQNILFFVHTEYHLLVAINQILQLYSDQNLYKSVIHVCAYGSNRVREDLDLSSLPCTIEYIYDEININKKLESQQIRFIQQYIEKKPDIFVFFLEQDPLMIILANELSKKGAEIHLYQDGLKPYVKLKYHSLGMIKLSYKMNRWLKENGFNSLGLLYLWNSKKYAHLKSISKVYLSFPESYDNWNRKNIIKFEMLELSVLREHLRKVFHYKDDLLPESENVIFYMNQPMHDDGKAEVQFLKDLHTKFPDNKIFIKLHPLTHEIDKVKLYHSIPNVSIIKSRIPAELFIIHLKKSIIMSINSTSMFINNPSCRYYYLYSIFKDKIKRLSRYHLPKPPSSHIQAAASIDEICF
jgi:hypothetical protein